MKEVQPNMQMPPNTLERHQKKLAALKAKRNRLSATLTAQNTRRKKSENAARKLRTRTLIQVGGLVHLSGLLDLCDIHEGDDLQLDLAAMNKAATLLGMLLTCVENLHDPKNFPKRNFERGKDGALHPFEDRGNLEAWGSNFPESPYGNFSTPLHPFTDKGIRRLKMSPYARE